MRLSLADLQLIPHLELDALRSIPALAKRIGVSSHSARYSLAKLFESGAVRIYPLINRAALGLVDYHVFFSLRTRSRAEESRFTSFLAGEEGVVFLVPLGGPYHYELIVTARHPAMLIKLFHRIHEHFPNAILEQRVATSVRYALYPKKYLALKKVETKEKFYIESASDQTLDDLESAMLRHLSQKTFTSWRDVSRALGVSLPPVLNRLSSLRKRGIFLGMCLDVEPLVYGYQSYVVLLERSGNSQAFAEKIFSVGRVTPQITQTTQFFGAWEYEFGVDVKEPEDLVPILQEIGERVGGDGLKLMPVQQFRSLRFSPYPFFS